VFGWGPRGGYVYQKAFVEFFAPERDVERIISKVESQGKGWVDYFAVNLEVCTAHQSVSVSAEDVLIGRFTNEHG
jgi:hypothetical protein